MVAEGLGFAFMPRQWAEALEARGVLQILKKGGALEPLHYVVQWRRDDARLLITEMRDVIKDVIEFQAPRCLV
ncbi:LysR substrate binding domain protein [compost metagenome]